MKCYKCKQEGKQPCCAATVALSQGCPLWRKSSADEVLHHSRANQVMTKQRCHLRAVGKVQSLACWAESVHGVQQPVWVVVVGRFDAGDQSCFAVALQTGILHAVIL